MATQPYDEPVEADTLRDDPSLIRDTCSEPHERVNGWIALDQYADGG